MRKRRRTSQRKNARPKRGRALKLKRLRSPKRRFDLRYTLHPDTNPRTAQPRSGFESRQKARAEDRQRVKSLDQWPDGKNRPGRHSSNAAYGFSREDARDLIERLSKQGLGQVPTTFASLAYTRFYRLAFCAAVLCLLHGVPSRKIRLYTIVPRTWRIPASQLATVKPKRLLAQFRAQLNRAGIAGKSGWLIAFVHGEYDPTDDTFQLHLHVLVVGEKVEAVESLRRLKRYQPSEGIAYPIRPRKLKNRPRQVSYYLAQAFWPSKPTLIIKGRRVRKRTRARIPEPRHAEVLMWLDRQTFADLIWLHGCALKDGRLQITPSQRRRSP